MKKKKCWKLAIEVPNAWGGMPHLWMYLEKKYLPSYVPVGADGKPLDLEWVKEKQAKGEYASRWIYASSRKEIEDLQKDFRLTYEATDGVLSSMWLRNAVTGVKESSSSKRKNYV